MSKKHIKHTLASCDQEITLDQFNNMAKHICAELNTTEYTKDKVRNIMAKYVVIKKGNIIFDTQNKSELEYCELKTKMKTINKNKNSFYNFNIKKEGSNDSYDSNVHHKKNKEKDDTPKKNNKPKIIEKAQTQIQTQPKKKSWFDIPITNERVENNNTTLINKSNNKPNNIFNTNKSTNYAEIYDGNRKYEYGPDYHYIPKKKLEPTGSQWVYDDQTDDKLTNETIELSNIVKDLMKREYPAQKSVKWHELRSFRATASDGGCVLYDNHYEPPFKFLYKKVRSPPFQSNINCYNGNKFEQTATMIYGYRKNVDVEEFGLIAHPTCGFLAASPDGIISPYKLDKQHLTKYAGRMLEIKCPTTRKIKPSGEIRGEICPIYYWDQVQLQLQCCKLKECDFWQCKLTEYVSRENFLEDTDPNEPFRSKTTGLEKGVLIQLMPKRLPDKVGDFEQLVKNHCPELFTGESSDKANFDISENVIKNILHESLISITNIDNHINITKNEITQQNTKKDVLKILKKAVENITNGTTVIQPTHPKTHYCNNYLKKSPANCEYCEAVYEHSKHLYPDKIDMTPYECDEWLLDVATNLSSQKLLDPALDVNDYYIDKIVYWKLDMSHCVTIERDDEWYAQSLPRIGKIWSYVEYFRKNQEKADIFFNYINSVTKEHPRFKDKDVEMSEDEIEKIMSMAEYICSEAASKSEYEKMLKHFQKQTAENNKKKSK